MTALTQITEIKERLAALHYFPGTSGNLAIRNDAQSLYVTTSGIDKNITHEDSFVRVDYNGQPIDSLLKPSLETVLHLEIFNRTEAQVSLHVHSVENNVISEIYGDDQEVTFKNQELIKAFGLWQDNDVLTIPIIENPADVTQLAQLFAKHIHQDYGAVLIRNHGLNVWGRSKDEALKLLEAAEFLFKYRLQLNAAQYYLHTLKER
ncbi:methylthioribulose 1-phosphate dehydratase [Macrococcoides canis]|uniref:methylthioribulose 1-phosphate dehydratase n=1 Tax=Macrococcoides canis TaxID=1855823 RepID=UPI001F39EBA4|nr:methylthioribulose 1-phosphate dehydratase [Macrococcus canis]UJS27638.1 methylthioribulose 1-phosphate dehydratase [Macrococcus canis]UTG99965.1 methylthioribulose 1-phosphate dehydratase [Macrococcus canis]WBF53046.1 methylthioribulose 1-phosphate dehydratase [Macrococcus canis]